MINTKITIDGTEYTEYLNLRVTKAISNNIASSNFTLDLPSPFGRHNDSFEVGNEIVIYADKDTDPATTKIFTGIVEKIKFKGKENTQSISLSGRDYIARLMDTTVEPVVYTNSEVSTIVTNIIDNELSDYITYTNVDTTGTTLKRISFNQTTVYEALKQLGKLAGYYFFVDDDKDLNFKKLENISSGVTLDNTNIIKMSSNKTREGMANKIWVYGDRYLSGFKEQLSAGSPLGGSIFTLLSKPHDTYVEYLGSAKKGGVYEMVSLPESGTQYLTSYQDRQIIFVSGPTLGDNIPASGGSVVVQYNRELPIVKFGQDRNSISLYGPKVKVVNDKSIKDPNTAVAILNKELEDINPFRGMNIEVTGWHSIEAGNTVQVDLDDFNVSETDIGVISVAYTFDKNKCLSEKVMNIRLDKKVKDITDEITDLRKRLDLIEAQDRQDTDVITRLETSVGSVMVVGSYWEVRTRSIAGDTLIYDSPNFGIYGTNKYGGGTLTYSFILGKNLTAVLGTSKLGANLSTYETIRSGGYY